VTDGVSCEPLVEPAYPLRDRHGRGQLLEDLTRRLVGLDTPLQVWHGHRPHLTLLRGDGAARVLTRELARTAQARQTVLIQPGDGEVPVSVPQLPIPAVRAAFVVVVRRPALGPRACPDAVPGGRPPMCSARSSAGARR
jgi:hypothetical protein